MPGPAQACSTSPGIGVRVQVVAPGQVDGRLSPLFRPAMQDYTRADDSLMTLLVDYSFPRGDPGAAREGNAWLAWL